MRQQEHREYPPGTNVFAKLKGYPWWPARIEPDQAVPAQVLKQKSKSKGTLYTVFFYGSKDYGFFGPDAIRPFDSVHVENDLKANKFKSKDLEFAVRQALNLSIEEVESTPKKIGKRKTRKLVQQEVDETAIKKSRKSMSIEEKVIIAAAEEEEEEEIDFKETPEYKRVYTIRHRLQRLVYNKREGEIPKEDYIKILHIITEIEDIPMTYNLLKETKIGKVVKAACSYPFENDNEIRERCQRLMRDWKTLIIDTQSNLH